jgi:hypothetical protein
MHGSLEEATGIHLGINLSRQVSIMLQQGSIVQGMCEGHEVRLV